MKQVAWAFLATDTDGEMYFIKNDNNEEVIFWKKPKPILQPFGYFKETKWKPTKIYITDKE